MDVDAALLLLDLESESDEEINIQCLSSVLSKKRKKGKTREFLRKRETHGEFTVLRAIPDDIFKGTFRVTRQQFYEIHEIIKEDIRGKECNAQRPIGTEQKLAVCLRYLATGDMYKTIALSYRMGERTVSNIVAEVCRAIWSHLQPVYMPQPDVELWETIALEYETKWQFYNCLGAIDGKHVTIRKPALSGSSFFNYKQFFSVVLMAAVDAQYRFTFVDIGSMGRFSDGNIFRNSSFGKRLSNGTLNLPIPKPLPGHKSPTPYVFVADEAFPLMENLMRPYPKASVTNNYRNKVFNYRLSRARQTVECTFGILSARFRVFKHPFECKLETVDIIVLACCVLHNYLRTQKLLCSDITEDVDEFEAPIESDNQFLPLRKSNTRSSNESFLIREKFKDFYNSAQGSVDWQRTAVDRGHF